MLISFSRFGLCTSKSANQNAESLYLNFVGAHQCVRPFFIGWGLSPHPSKPSVLTPSPRGRLTLRESFFEERSGSFPTVKRWVYNRKTVGADTIRPFDIKKAPRRVLFLFHDAFMTPIVVDNFRFAHIDVKIKLIAIHKGIQRIVIVEHCFLA